MNLPRPRIRDEDSGMTPVWRSRAVTWSVKIAFALAGALGAMGVIRTIPGGVVIGSAADVRALAARVDSADRALEEEHSQMLTMDTTHERAIRALERSVTLLTDMQKAQTRDRCGELGFAKAERLGYPCSEVGFHLPGTP